MAVCSCLSNELRSGDIYIAGAETYSDYRSELLDWESCKPLIDEYCSKAGISNNAKDYVKKLRDGFIEVADRVDKTFPDITEFVIDDQGNLILKKRSAKKRTRQAIWLSQEIRNRMPERNLLDILCNTHHYTGWTYELGLFIGRTLRISKGERYKRQLKND